MTTLDLEQPELSVIVEPLVSTPLVTPCTEIEFQAALNIATPNIKNTKYTSTSMFAEKTLQEKFLDVTGDTALENLKELIGGMKGVLEELEKGKDLLPPEEKQALEKTINEIRESLTVAAAERFFREAKNKDAIKALQEPGKDSLAVHCYVVANNYLKALYEKLPLNELGALYLLQGNMRKTALLPEVINNIICLANKINLVDVLKKESAQNTVLLAPERYALVNDRIQTLKAWLSAKNQNGALQKALKTAQGAVNLNTQFETFTLAGGERYDSEHRERMGKHADLLLQTAHEKLNAALAAYLPEIKNAQMLKQQVYACHNAHLKIKETSTIFGKNSLTHRYHAIAWFAEQHPSSFGSTQNLSVDPKMSPNPESVFQWILKAQSSQLAQCKFEFDAVNSVLAAGLEQLGQEITTQYLKSKFGTPPPINLSMMPLNDLHVAMQGKGSLQQLWAIHQEYLQLIEKLPKDKDNVPHPALHLQPFLRSKLSHILLFNVYRKESPEHVEAKLQEELQKHLQWSGYNDLRPLYTANVLINHLNIAISGAGKLWQCYVPEQERTLPSFIKIIQQDPEVSKGLLGPDIEKVWAAFDRMVGCSVTGKDWPGAVQKAFNRLLVLNPSFALDATMYRARNAYAQLTPEQKEFLELEVQLRTPSEDRGDISITELEQRVAKKTLEIAQTLLQPQIVQQVISVFKPPAINIEVIESIREQVTVPESTPNAVPPVPPPAKLEIKSSAITPERIEEILATLNGEIMENKMVPPKNGPVLKNPWFYPVVLRPREAKELGVTLEWLRSCNKSLNLIEKVAASTILKRFNVLYDKYKDYTPSADTEEVFFGRNVVNCTRNEFRNLGLVDKLKGMKS